METQDKHHPTLSIAETADGSKTIYNPEVGEHYHSKHGAVQESKHVFLGSGLKYYLERSASSSASILEVGFGTGLNFLLSLDYAIEQRLNLNYTGIEAYPLNEDLLFETGYESEVSNDTWEQFKQNYRPSLEAFVSLNSHCNLHISHCLLENFVPDRPYDIVYFDAFAAIHQPEMWTTEALAICTQNLRQGGVFVTYAITGNLKRSMKSLGFSIEKAPGAPGKREMLRAIKL